MIIRRKRKSAIRRKRRNPVSPARSGKVRSNSKRKRSRMRGKRVRPLLWKRGSGKKASYHRGPRSKMPTRINKRKRYSRRRNPGLKIKSLFSKQMFMGAASIAGGIVLGYLIIPLVHKFAPDAIKNNRKFLGIANVVIGALMATMLKNKNLKSMGLVVAGTGIYDLIAANFGNQLDLPMIPTDNRMFDNMLGGALSIEHQGASYPGYMVPSMSMGASYSPSLNASYEAVGNVYEEMGCF